MSRNTKVSISFKFSFYLACGAALVKEVYKEEGDSEYGEGEYNYAIVCYTEGINQTCNMENCGTAKNVNAKLFTNRAAANLQLGEYCPLFLFC